MTFAYSDVTALPTILHLSAILFEVQTNTTGGAFFNLGRRCYLSLSAVHTVCQHVFQFLCSSQARYKQKLKLCGLKDFSGDVWLNDPQEWPPVDFGNFYLINTLIDFFGSGGFCVTGSFLEQAIAHSALLFRKTAYLELLSSFFHEMRALAGPGTTPLNHGTD